MSTRPPCTTAVKEGPWNNPQFPYNPQADQPCPEGYHRVEKEMDIEIDGRKVQYNFCAPIGATDCKGFGVNAGKDLDAYFGAKSNWILWIGGGILSIALISRWRNLQ
jgi:hypothetical protein